MMSKNIMLMIGLIFIILLLSGCNAWEDVYEQGAASSYTVVSVKCPAAFGLIKAMEPSIEPVVMCCWQPWDSFCLRLYLWRFLPH